MRIRELVLHNLRSFRQETHISFVDPRTSRVRPVTAIAGRDEAAKATVLEAIEALLSYAIDPRHPKAMIGEAMADGLIRMELELSPDDLEQFYQQALPPESLTTRVLRIEVGRQGIAPLLPVQEWSRFLACLAPDHAADETFTNAGALSSQLLTAVARMHRGALLHGGLLYFPGQPPAARSMDGAAAVATGADPRAAEHTWIVRAPVKATPDAGEVWPGAAHPAAHPAMATATVGPGWSASPLGPTSLSHDPAPIPGGVAAVEPMIEDTQAIPLFGVLRERQRPGAVIAIEAPAIPPQPARQRRTIDRLRRLAHEWDAQLILTVHSDEILDAFPDAERVFLD
jgi:hypothetical protein